MNRILAFWITLCAFCTVASAQFALPRFRVELGGHASDIITKVSSGNMSHSISLGDKYGLRAAASVELALLNLPKTKLYIAPGLAYRNLGSEYKIPQGLLDEAIATGKVSGSMLESLGSKSPAVTLGIHSLSLPLQLGVRTSLVGGWSLALEAGPYASYAFSNYGKVNIPGIDGAEFKSDDLDYENKLQAGISASILLGYNRFYLRVGYDRDLISISNLDEVSQYNAAWGASIGFRL